MSFSCGTVNSYEVHNLSSLVELSLVFAGSKKANLNERGAGRCIVVLIHTKNAQLRTHAVGLDASSSTALRSQIAKGAEEYGSGSYPSITCGRSRL